MVLLFILIIDGGYSSFATNVRISNDGTWTNYDAENKSDEWGKSYNNIGVKGNLSSIIYYDENLNQSQFKRIFNGKILSNITKPGKRIVYRNDADSYKNFYIGLADQSYRLWDDVYFVRVYNRALTNEEAVHNYYIDLYRFKEEI